MIAITKTRQPRISSPVLAGLIFAFAWMGGGALILSLLLFATGMKEASLPLYTFILHAVSLWFGGLAAGKRAKSKGWSTGGIVGVIYAIIVILVAFLGFNKGVSLSTAVFLAGSFLAGSAGGMVGVNSGK
jgi:putative membrane protein (TIGR04086 family)